MRPLLATPQDVFYGQPRPINLTEDDVRWSDTTLRLQVNEPVRLQAPQRYEALTLEAWRRGELR